MRDDGDELAVLARDARLPDRGLPADMDRRRLSAVTVVPSFAAARKFVLLSMVVGVGLARMFSTAPMAPSASANARIAPPCMICPAVQRSGRTTSCARTKSLSALRTSTPIQRGKGLVRYDSFPDIHGTSFPPDLRYNITQMSTELPDSRRHPPARDHRAQREDRRPRFLGQAAQGRRQDPVRGGRGGRLFLRRRSGHAVQGEGDAVSRLWPISSCRST